MRKVEAEVIGAFLAGRARRVGNTSTDGRTLKLHGNEIARRDCHGRLEVSMAGWSTVTTRSRLNALLILSGSRYRIRQRKHEQELVSEDIVLSLDPCEWVRVTEHAA